MFFADDIPEEKQGQYRALLERCASAISDSVSFLWDAVQAASRKAPQPEAPILALVRHAVEMLDGASVLVSRGCASACDALLRSALEAMLSVFFMLEGDTNRRAFAYLV